MKKNLNKYYKEIQKRKSPYRIGAEVNGAILEVVDDIDGLLDRLVVDKLGLRVQLGRNLIGGLHDGRIGMLQLGQLVDQVRVDRID